MDSVGVIALIVYTASAALLWRFHREIKEAIEDFKNNLPRGGPRTPMHPSPANDRVLALRKRSR